MVIFKKDDLILASATIHYIAIMRKVGYDGKYVAKSKSLDESHS